MLSEVIIIDDNKLDLFVCKKIIEKYNPTIRTRTFSSAISAISYLKLCQKEDKPKTIVIPDLILLDINMSQMDGFQFIEALKADDFNLPKMPQIYMLSSSLYIEDISKSDNEPYCSGYLNKPLTVDKFSSICSKKVKSKPFKNSYLKLL